MNEIFKNYTDEEMKVINISIFAAQFTGTPAPKNAEELKAFCDTAIAEHNAEEQRKAKAKATKAEKEKAKAEAMGLTVEEFRRLKGKKSAVTRVSREIEELEKELKAKKAYLERVKKEIKEIEG